MPLNKIKNVENAMIEVLRSCDGALELSGTDSFMLAIEVAELGKPIESITLGEFRAAYERVVKHCNGW